MEELRTVRGRPLTVPVSFRLELPAYRELRRRANECNLSMSKLLLQYTEAMLQKGPDHDQRGE